MKISKEQFADFTVLVLRWYLAFYMTSYGWAKLNGAQFGVHDPKILERPIHEIDKFYIAWHLFSLNKSFNFITGLMELIGAGLIVVNRTVLIGALFLLPVLGEIFLIDLAFTTNVFGFALPVRLGGMLLADLLILYYYRDIVLAAFRTLTSNISTRFSYQWWVYPILLVAGFLTDFTLALFTYPIKMLLNWINF